jgi:hypothetical protein
LKRRDRGEELGAEIAGLSGRREIAHASQELDQMRCAGGGGLPRLIGFAVRDHERTIGATPDQGLGRRAQRLGQGFTICPQSGRRLGEQQPQKLLGGERVVCRHLGERVQKHSGAARLVHFHQRVERLVAVLRRHAPANQDREVHRPVLHVFRLALDEHQLLVRQSAELIFDRAKRQIEEDARSLLCAVRVSGRAERHDERGGEQDT